MLSRIYLPGEIYFITTNIYQRSKIFNKDWACKLFIDVLNKCRLKYRFKLYGYVIIPDHVHLLIMPDDKMNISEIIHRIKGNFAYQYIMARNHEGSATRGGLNHASKRVADPLWVGDHRIHINPIWQKSFYDHIIRNDLDFEEKLGYIHGNPIKHRLIDNLDNYPWSSYQNYYFNHNDLIEIDYLEL